MQRCVTGLIVGLMAMAAADRSAAADWPQWQGPDRNGISKETGLLQSWDKGGPPLAWTAKNLGLGFGTPSVAAGKIFGMGSRDGKDGVWALKESDGSELWFTAFDDTNSPNQNNGPCCTPTFDNGKLYAVSSKGKIVRLDATTGKKEWLKDFVKDFGGEIPHWAYTESPLIDGDKVICTPGGKNTIVALDKENGEVVWKAAVPKADPAQYASATAIEIGGQRQYVQFVRGGVVSVAASDGAFLWRYDAPANGTANCSTPIFHDNCIFAASAYSKGGGMAEIKKTGDKYEADEKYFEKRFQNHHGGYVLVDGYLYGECSGKLGCIEFKTGKLVWTTDKVRKGSTTYADGRLYCRNEGGADVILVEANPKQYVEKGRFAQPDRSGEMAWPHPVIANGKLYFRDQDVLLCYDVKQK
ncbi:MAG TPA: PQQ-binding-like beta-propeller repeat protein [Fimbriiglobus sp.]|jgi:outer membrane protein assembly factor BamB